MKKPSIPRIREGLDTIKDKVIRSACAKFAWWRMISDREGVKSSDEIHSLQDYFVPSVRPVFSDVMEENLVKLGYSSRYVNKQLVSARTSEAHRRDRLATMPAKKQKDMARCYERAITDRERQIGVRL